MTVPTRVQRGSRHTTAVRPVFVNGEAGVVAWDAGGRLIGVLACTVVDGRIVEIQSVNDPKRLASADLPARPE